MSFAIFKDDKSSSVKTSTLKFNTQNPEYETLSSASVVSLVVTTTRIINYSATPPVYTLASATDGQIKNIELENDKCLPVIIQTGQGAIWLAQPNGCISINYKTDHWEDLLGNVTWVPQTIVATLIGTGHIGNALQGYSVSLSADGNTLAIGARADNANIGATWIFIRTNGVWNQQGTKLVGSGNTGAAFQGQSVSLSADGNTLAVGGYFDNTNQGRIWIWTRSSGIWTEQQNFIGTGNVGDASQGQSVSLSADGNTVAFGGPNDNGGQGRVWIWTRSSGVWTQQQNFIGTGNTGPALQGQSVSLSADGNTVVWGGYLDNGGQGRVWVWTRSAGVWTQQQNFVGTGNTGAAQQGWSISLSADGNKVAFGGPNDNTNQGAAWIWTRNAAGTWSQLQSKLVGTGNIGNALQGISVSLSSDGNTLVAGGSSDNTNTGATWIFIRTSNGSYIQLGSKIVSSGRRFQGGSISLSSNGDTLAVGCPNSVGATYIVS